MLRTFSATAGTLVLSLFKAISKPGSSKKAFKKKKKKKTQDSCLIIFASFPCTYLVRKDESKAERLPPTSV